jgi:hypothetical protein
MSKKIYLNDIGAQFVITIIKNNKDVIDISNAISKTIIFQKPNDLLVLKNATFYTDGKDGKICYVSTYGDLDMVGLWKMQCHIITPSTNWHSSFLTFKIHRNL